MTGAGMVTAARIGAAAPRESRDASLSRASRKRNHDYTLRERRPRAHFPLPCHQTAPRRKLAVAQDGEQSAGGLRSDAYSEPAYVGKRVILHASPCAPLSATSGAELPVRTLVANRTTERIASWDPIDSKHRR